MHTYIIHGIGIVGDSRLIFAWTKKLSCQGPLHAPASSPIVHTPQLTSQPADNTPHQKYISGLVLGIA